MGRPFGGRSIPRSRRSGPTMRRGSPPKRSMVVRSSTWRRWSRVGCGCAGQPTRDVQEIRSRPSSVQCRFSWGSLTPGLIRAGTASSGKRRRPPWEWARSSAATLRPTRVIVERHTSPPSAIVWSGPRWRVAEPCPLAGLLDELKPGFDL